MSDSIVHVAGLDVEMEGRFLRQRCAWCGVILLDEDYSALTMPGEWKRPAVFTPGALVRVTGTFPVVTTTLEDKRLPDDACFVASEVAQ